jgi:putative transposase
MTSRSTPLVAGQYYHLYNRGVNHQPIFFCEENWAFFLQQVRLYFQLQFVEILAYCLMPNHYHFLVYLKTDDFSARIMQPFSVSYTKAVNKQQHRVGPLFQGPFQSARIGTNAYLIHLSRYIHLNPLKGRLVEKLSEWTYSSYPEYLGIRKGHLPRMDMVMEFFPGSDAYRQFVEAPGDQEVKGIEQLLLD